jgi:cysteine desulfurase/selenocysteine lyase
MIDNATLEGATFPPAPSELEAGAPPIAGAVRPSAALAWAQRPDSAGPAAHRRMLIPRLIEGLDAIGGIHILGPHDVSQRIGAVSFMIEGHSLDVLCHSLDARGIAEQPWHHSAPLPLSVLVATQAARAIYNMREDINSLLEAVENAF